MSLQQEMTLLEQHSPKGTLDLFAPQAVDEWVQHGVEETVKQGKDLRCSSGWWTWGPWT